MATPVAVALLFLMAAAPALPWRATSSEVLRRRLLVPAYVGGATMLVVLALGTRGLTTVLAFGLAAFALAGIVRQFVVGARARRRAEGEPWPTATSRMIGSNPRLYGGLVVHTGIVCIAVAIASFGAFITKHDVQLTRGQSATVSGYTVTYLGTRTTRSTDKNSVKALVRIRHGSSDLEVYAPAISTFRGANEGIGTPSVKTGVLRDVYLTLVSSPNERGRVTIGVGINPMVIWLWIGGFVIAAGTVLALAPRLRRRGTPPYPEIEEPAILAGPPAEKPEAVPV
jgi:cytochrome c-type biogenesis protein CcmF